MDLQINHSNLSYLSGRKGIILIPVIISKQLIVNLVRPLKFLLIVRYL